MIKYKVLRSPKSIAYIFNQISINRFYEINGSFQHWVKESPSEFRFLVTAFDTTNGRLVGYAIVRPFEDRYSYNTGVWVNPNYRRQGIGLSIMKLVQAKRTDKLVVDDHSVARDYFYSKVQFETGLKFNECKL